MDFHKGDTILCEIRPTFDSILICSSVNGISILR